VQSRPNAVKASPHPVLNLARDLAHLRSISDRATRRTHQPHMHSPSVPSRQPNVSQIHKYHPRNLQRPPCPLLLRLSPLPCLHRARHPALRNHSQRAARTQRCITDYGEGGWFDAGGGHATCGVEIVRGKLPQGREGHVTWNRSSDSISNTKTQHCARRVSANRVL
jgi:hypothetical protein